MNNRICIISGPTASGKTQTSINLARRFGGEIVNFDSLLFYKEITIGTAKPSTDEMNGIPHHLIDTNSIKEDINASEYLKLALPVIEKLHSQDKTVYLVGGSGFYLQALLYGMFDSKTTSEDVIKKSDNLYEDQGIEPFLEVLKINDPGSFTAYHANDHYRVRRAVEHFWNNGTQFSKKKELMLKQREQTSNIKKYGWDVLHIHLDLPKEEHLQIIENRTKRMLNLGLADEIRTLKNIGYTMKEKPLQSIGYKETIAFLENQLTEEELVEKINIATRQLAKAQRTWFKKIDKNVFHPLLQIKEIEDIVGVFLKK